MANDVSIWERLKAKAAEVANKLNNSSLGKSVEKQITPNPNSNAPTIAIYQKTSDATSRAMPTEPKKVTDDPEQVHRAIVAVQGKAMPVVRAGYNSIPQPVKDSVVTLATGKSPEKPKTAQEIALEDKQRLIDALRYQQEMNRIQELRQKLTSGN